VLEIEMKFPVADFDRVERLLRDWKARPEGEHVESDHYYNAPDRDFARTDEALRLRRIGSENQLTYKGPKHPGPTKTRTEIELPIAPGDDAAKTCLRLLEHLAYRPSAVVRKTRRTYGLDRSGFAIQACLDDVEEVGRFVEIEIVAPPEQRDIAQQLLLALAAEMQLGQSERRSYLQMLLEKRGHQS
jgi:adenylate cyclase class 2